jgi:acetolactate synthase-1/2/3 large subunit
MSEQISPLESAAKGSIVIENTSGAQALMRSLLDSGVDTIFGYPGGAIMPVYDALYDVRDKMRHILVRHEQGAIHAAQGYAQTSGKPGVCLVTSGPGATNLVTGIADAMIDSIPLVCITGQVNSRLLGTDAFQESDVIGVTIPITKWNYQVSSAEEIPFIIEKAFHIATTGRPGPVLIDITKDAQIENFNWNDRIQKEYRYTYGIRKVENTALVNAAELINSAKKPYLLVGHGVLISGAIKEVVELAEKADIPAACTLLGLSAFPPDHPLYAGMLGMHGNYGPNLLTNEADLLIAVGMRFDDRVTGDLSTYARQAKVVHIEIDPAEIGKCIRTDVGLVGDAKEVLKELLPLVDKAKHPEWIAKFDYCRQMEDEKVILKALKSEGSEIKMSDAVNLLSEMTEGQSLIVADVGQHQMMAARYYKYRRPQSWISSGGLGTMGYALPAALGAWIGNPERQVVAIIGDGGFQMTAQELGTIMQEKIPVKIIILNNCFLGMVRQWQELFFEGRYSFVHLDNPDFIKLAEAYSIPAESVLVRNDLEKAYKRMLESTGPYLLDVRCEKEQNVFPMVPSGAGVADIRLE